MAAAAFTKISSSPEMLRYHVTSTDGALGKQTVTQLLADCAKGPLASLITQMNTAGSWGANSAAIASPNPATNAKISVSLTPYTAGSGTITASASYQWYNDGSANVIGVLGGLRGDTTVLSAYTDAILELRFVHSIQR